MARPRRLRITVTIQAYTIIAGESSGSQSPRCKRASAASRGYYNGRSRLATRRRSVEIVAQENTKTLMARMDAFKGDKAQFLPKQTYKDRLTLGTGKDRVELYYFGAGHTGGDTWVFFPALRILQTGDMFAWKDAPLLDRANNGSGVEFPKTIAKAIATIKDFDTVIPGHSPVMKPADLQEYQRYTADLLAQTEAAIKAGKSAADASAGINLTAKYTGYKSDRQAAAVAAIYQELGK